MMLGQRIKDCRQRCALTQEQLAEKMSVSRQAVTKWESGQSAPSTDNLFRLADIFGTTVDFLLTESESSQAKPDTPLLEPHPESPAAVLAGWISNMKDRICAAAFTGLGYYIFFLICKAVYCTKGSDYGLFHLLFEADFRHLPYLFGWLLSSHMYPVCAIISMLCALLGNPWATWLTCLAFPAGVILGEAFGQYGMTQWELDNGYHNGWAIWLCIYFGALLLGIAIKTLFATVKLHLSVKKAPF